MEILQNKCIRFCVNLNNRVYIELNEFKQINWLPVNERFEQIIRSMSLKICNNTSPTYMNDVFKPAVQPNATTRASSLKLNQPLRRTNHCQKNISHIPRIIWKNLPNPPKTTNNLTLKNTELSSIFFTKEKMSRTIYIAKFFFMHNHFSFLLLILFLLLLNDYYSYY